MGRQLRDTAWRPALLAALLLFSVALRAAPPQQAAVASAQPSATVAGLETLAMGGNAFDAAVAISAALAVAEPHGSGLGGGGFFLLRKAGDKQPTYLFLDARERAPLAARPDLYLRDGKVQPQLSINGPLAAAIPGLPAALVDLAQHHGRLPLGDSLAPAIRLARDGISVDRVYIERAGFRIAAMRDDPETARIFLDDKGEVPDEFSLLRQPDLARTLERIARYGKAGFYAGETADKLVKGVRAAGGIWTQQDLDSYRVVERQPLRYALADGRELIGAPPPSAGGVALAQSLAMLQQLPWREGDKLQRTHYVVEVLRRAYRDRGLLGDPDFIANPVSQLLAPDYLKGLAAGKRPLSSMSPTFIESAKEFTAFGTPGGSRIPSMVLLSILEYLDGQPVARWPAVPRYHHQYLPDVIEHEPSTFSDAEIAALQARGYALKRVERGYGNQQVLFWDKDGGRIEAASDPRGVGLAKTLPEQR